MGWFDNESDEEEPSSHLHSFVENSDNTLGINLPKNNELGQRKDEEEDPLDAYMSGIDKQLQISKMHSTLRNERLDEENEEEATSHWQTSDLKRNSEVEQDDHDDEPVHISAAAASFHDSFQKPAVSSVHKPNNIMKNLHKDHRKTDTHDDDDDDYDLGMIKDKHRHVEPLDKCNHSSKTYPPFRRKFYDPINTEDGKAWRKDFDITCSIDTVDPILSFAVLGTSPHNRSPTILPNTILEYLDTNGYKEPTLVQSQCLPLALSGRDLLVTSHTGSGKTLAYILPLIVHILDQPHIQSGIDGPIALILTPTRELTRQIFFISKKMLKLVDAVAYAVTGGVGTYEMTKELKKGCEVVISTPGRWIDMIKKKASNFNRTTLVVLDEADKMLDMGFETQVASILENIRPDRQTWMFSATMGRKVERLAKRWLMDPIRVSVGKSNTSSEHVTQNVIVLPSYEMKKEWMRQMLPIFSEIGRMIIFVASRVDCEEIAQEMRDSPHIGGKGLVIGSLHGDKHQSDRSATLTAFRKGTISALVATDVAARGLDVTDVMTVINFDAAKNLDSHIHRIGRCGRLSASADSTQEHKKGNAYTILTPSDCNFANILLESFLREGREVSDEFMDLASKSKHFGGGGRQTWNKSGLGYAEVYDHVGSNYYGPMNQPSSKRLRRD